MNIIAILSIRTSTVFEQNVRVFIMLLLTNVCDLLYLFAYLQN